MRLMSTMNCMLVEVHWLNIVLIVVMVIKFMMSLVVNMVCGDLVLMSVRLMFVIFMRITLALIKITSVWLVVLVTSHTGWTYIMVFIML